jgi:hypothetical protein
MLPYIMELSIPINNFFMCENLPKGKNQQS